MPTAGNGAVTATPTSSELPLLGLPPMEHKDPEPDLAARLDAIERAITRLDGKLAALIITSHIIQQDLDVRKGGKAKKKQPRPDPFHMQD